MTLVPRRPFLLGALLPLLPLLAWPGVAMAANKPVHCHVKGAMELGSNQYDGLVRVRNTSGFVIKPVWKVRWVLNDGRSGWINGGATVVQGQYFPSAIFLSNLGYPFCKSSTCKSLGLQCKAVVYFRYITKIPKGTTPRVRHPRKAPRPVRPPR
jgi:hypothetical protein